MTDFRGEDNE
jgi:hypothetical protein